MKIGIFIGRMQPIHLWHQKTIETSIKENDLTFIILWSSWLTDENNIFTDEQRQKIVKTSLKKLNKKKIITLCDNNSDELWVKNLNTLIHITWQKYLEATLSRLLWWKKINTEDIEVWKQDFSNQLKTITFYCWDLRNDYAIKTIKEFEKIIDCSNIKYKEIHREELVINHMWEELYISSTRVRKELGNQNYELLEKMLDRKVLAKIKKI